MDAPAPAVTLRELAALVAMHGFIASGHAPGENATAKLAVLYADKLLKELDR